MARPYDKVGDINERKELWNLTVKIQRSSITLSFSLYSSFNSSKFNSFYFTFSSDVIGIVDEVGYTQSMVGKKPQINFILRDLGTYMIIINMSDTGKYLLAVTNTYNVTTVHINEEIPEIIDFLSRMPTVLPLPKSQGSTGKSSHDCSQQTSGGHLSPADKFFSKASQLPLSEIIVLSEPIMCVTVSTTDKLIPDTNGCFRICVEVVHDGTAGRFVFWDREAAELLETSVATLRSTMVESGITDPMNYPFALDKLLGKKFSFKINWNPRFKNGSVVINWRALARVFPWIFCNLKPYGGFPYTDPESKVVKISLTNSCSSLVSIEQEGEISSAPIPDPITPLAYVKRMPPEDAVESPMQPLGEGDLSSTKVKKVAKRGKKYAT
ncbi:uncharacterized protein LOC131618916 [Vicia villosa]|uniref:uncharacterized protein LOC131618916 n=1 Tax=Vicia villosa TaxID=3911 RepID=UPI00273AD4B8|nr:uncharacterized protein LOC131618916 [Vicia villosa]